MQRSINFNEEFCLVLCEIGGANIILDIGGDHVARNIRAAHADARLSSLPLTLGQR